MPPRSKRKASQEAVNKDGKAARRAPRTIVAKACFFVEGWWTVYYLVYHKNYDLESSLWYKAYDMYFHGPNDTDPRTNDEDVPRSKRFTDEEENEFAAQAIIYRGVSLVSAGALGTIGFLNGTGTFQHSTTFVDRLERAHREYEKGSEWPSIRESQLDVLASSDTFPAAEARIQGRLSSSYMIIGKGLGQHEVDGKPQWTVYWLRKVAEREWKWTSEIDPDDVKGLRYSISAINEIGTSPHTDYYTIKNVRLAFLDLRPSPIDRVICAQQLVDLVDKINGWKPEPVMKPRTPGYAVKKPSQVMQIMSQRFPSPDDSDSEPSAGEEGGEKEGEEDAEGSDEAPESGALVDAQASRQRSSSVSSKSEAHGGEESLGDGGSDTRASEDILEKATEDAGTDAEQITAQGTTTASNDGEGAREDADNEEGTPAEDPLKQPAAEDINENPGTNEEDHAEKMEGREEGRKSPRATELKIGKDDAAGCDVENGVTEVDGIHGDSTASVIADESGGKSEEGGGVVKVDPTTDIDPGKSAADCGAGEEDGPKVDGISRKQPGGDEESKEGEEDVKVPTDEDKAAQDETREEVTQSEENDKVIPENGEDKVDQDEACGEIMERNADDKETIEMAGDKASQEKVDEKIEEGRESEKGFIEKVEDPEDQDKPDEESGSQQPTTVP